MNNKQFHAADRVGEPGFVPPFRTPLFEAHQADRYNRHRLIEEIQEEIGRTIICYVAGKHTSITLDDVPGFVDLLSRVRSQSAIDLVLRSVGGSPDAAEKLITMVSEIADNGELRVVVPHYAKSAATLMALGADVIVMSDSSELGPIDPQIRFPNDQGGIDWHSSFSYLEAFRRFTDELRQDPEDLPAELMVRQFRPQQVIEIERAVQRTRHLAEALLRSRMMAGNPTTTPVQKLMDVGSWHTHGQVIAADDAAEIGLSVVKLPPDDPVWAKYWRLYCLQSLAVPSNKKLFESDYVSLITDDA